MQNSPTPSGNTKRRHWLWRFLKITLIASAVGVVVGIATLMIGYFIFSRGLPPTNKVVYTPEQISVVVDRNDGEIAELGQVKRRFITFDQVSPLVWRSVIAVEDKRFMGHDGVDFRGLVRAALADLKCWCGAQGGSTITQQVVKWFFLSREKSLGRKFREMILARNLEAELTAELGSKRKAKERILELYLNRISYGDNQEGIEAAAKYYFGKRTQDIKNYSSPVDAAQAALLAGIPQNPSLLAPRNHSAAALKRRDWVLHRMLEEKVIDRKVYELARQVFEKPMLGAPPTAPEAADRALNLVACAELVRQKVFAKEEDCVPLSQIKDEAVKRNAMDAINKSGTVVRTTVHGQVQALARQALERGLEAHDKAHPGALKNGLQGAVVVLDPHTREIWALVGRYKYRLGQLNLAERARRQPGSTIKPFVYASGIALNVFTAATIFEDKPVEFLDDLGRVWAPSNYEPEFKGPMTARTALAESVNTVAAQAIDVQGVQPVIDLAYNAGLESLRGYRGGLSFSLGTKEVTPLELANGYASLLTGEYDRAFMVRAVGEKEFKRGQPFRILSPQIAYIITSMMRSVVEHGTAQLAKKLGFPVVGKTGTTSGHRDAWFAGYSPDLVVVVWVGYEDGKRILWKGGTGATVTLPIWVDVMRGAHDVLKAEAEAKGEQWVEKDFAVPAGIVWVSINPQDGKRWEGQGASSEPFIAGTEPREFSTNAPTVITPVHAAPPQLQEQQEEPASQPEAPAYEEPPAEEAQPE